MTVMPLRTIFHRFASTGGLAGLLILATSSQSAGDEASATDGKANGGSTYAVGVASIDISPAFPVRLSGYAVRTTESEGVEDPIHARALAVSNGAGEPPAVLLTVDTCILSQSIRDEIAARVEAEHKVPGDRVTINVSHSHTTPMLAGTVPNMFGQDVPAEHAERIERYTRFLIDRCVEVAGKALQKSVPCTLHRGEGTATFAANRRRGGGPTEPAVPVLCARREDGRVHAVVANYACHCTTLGGDFNRVSPDWAGYAAAALEARYPGAVVLVTIGCGADQNPAPRTGIDLARGHGLALADAVKGVVDGSTTPVAGPLNVAYRTVELALAEPPAVEQWKTVAKQTDAAGRHARLQLARIDRGESLADHVDLPVQTWAWGDDLAMVFLGGEVVVDYALRLKQELDGERAWICGYSNAVPCYIPSERILTEGGYEGGGAMIYYDLPGPFRPGLEQTIVDEVERQLGDRFVAKSEPANDESLRKAAATILDDALPNEQRERQIAAHEDHAAELLRLLASDLEPGTAEERRRIPWIWRVTVAAGKRNEPAELAGILDVALPRQGEPLREWQAVVLGGGIVNGIGLIGAWPDERLTLVFEEQPDLLPRWKAALKQAAAMADDEAVASGTRYDALRMVALDAWDVARPILERYLADENRELQQGAVSGLSDVRNEHACRLLLAELDDLGDSNREFALDALVRGPQRMRMTLDAIEDGRLRKETLGDDRLKRLRDVDDPQIRERAVRLK